MHTDRRRFCQAILGAAASAITVTSTAPSRAGESRKPNILLIVADDFGYSELGCYGQEKIRTPNLDRLAFEGMRFTQYYSGSPVCAPSRCTLLSGKHSGHAFIRNNREAKPEGQFPISQDTHLLAQILQEEGYATAAIGKWGLGPVGSSGDPNLHGFDLFFGYNCQRHAHNYYPSSLYRNAEKVPCPGNNEGLTGETYAPDRMREEALQFIRDNREKPFFLYYPTTVPHLALQVPDDSLQEYLGLWPDPPYDGKSGGYLPHDHPRAAYAAMITRMDRDIGQILRLLKELNLEENTLVIFTSDNGPTYLDGPDTDFFDSNGPLRGKKGDLYEGGIRVPLLARWPGRIPAGSQTDLPAASWDMLPTLAAIAGSNRDSDTDGIDLSPTLFQKPGQEIHQYLYWEFPAYGGQQAVRMDDWKAIRTNLLKKDGDHSLQLYNLKTDIGEEENVAQDHPEIVEQAHAIMASARTPSTEFPFPFLDGQ